MDSCVLASERVGGSGGAKPPSVMEKLESW